MDGRDGRPLEAVASLLPSLFEAAPFGVAFCDRGLTYLDVNAAFAAMSGRPRAAHIGRHVSDVLPRMSGQIAPCLEAVFTTGRPLLDVELRGWRNPAADTAGHWVASYHPVPSGERIVAVVADRNQPPAPPCPPRERANAPPRFRIPLRRGPP